MDINTEFPKEIQDKAFEAIEIAKKTGKIKKGANEVTKTIERGTAKLVVAAKDVNPKEIIMHLPALCEEKGIPMILVDTKDNLGTAAGLPVSTTAVSITNEGEGKSKVKALTEALKSM